jgi:hypothetical protein
VTVLVGRWIDIKTEEMLGGRAEGTNNFAVIFLERME